MLLLTRVTEQKLVVEYPFGKKRGEILLKRTISVMVGKGSVNHNSRKFTAQNVDKERTENNIVYCNENIKNVYRELFGEAVERYNAKQTRNDRKIDNYYEKIRTGKQEKLFHEIILQVGNCDDMNAQTENGQVAKNILDKYMQDFQNRNPNLRVFSAHLHMDEATPHLHIDFVPFTTGSQRGLDTRVSLKKALAAQGFEGGSRSDTEWKQWVNSEKEKLSEVMLEYGIEWEQKGTHEKHKTVSEFKRDKLIEEVENLQEKKADIEQKISTYRNAEEYAAKTAEKIISDDYKILEPPPLMSAKIYKNKVVEPLVKKLINIIKTLARKCYAAEKQAEQATRKMTELYQGKERLKSENWDLRMVNSKMSVEVRNFERIKDLLGIDRLQELLKFISKTKHKSRSDMMK